jgi:anaerobic C4-dicarboxylate transporter
MRTNVALAVLFCELYTAWAGLWTTLKYCGTVCFIVQLFHFLWISYNSWKAGKKLEKDPEYLAKLGTQKKKKESTPRFSVLTRVCRG